MIKSLSWWGRAGTALFLLHLALLFFPPIPPYIKGALWSYLAGYGSVVLLLGEVWRRRAPIVFAWTHLGGGRRWISGLGSLTLVLVIGVVMLTIAPTLLVRFSREEGLWEPLALGCYFAAALILLGESRGVRGRRRRHWTLVAAIYALLGLEEIDYFGVFGFLIGRIDGTYVGSPHDLIMLAAKGALSPTLLALFVGMALSASVVLARRDYLQPRALLAMILTADFVWILLGSVLLILAALAEADIFAGTAQPKALEEVLELGGAICYLTYGLSAAARQIARDRISA